MNLKQTINKMIERINDINRDGTIHPGDVQAVLDYYIACELSNVNVLPQVQLHGDAIVRKFGQQICDAAKQVLIEKNIEGDHDELILASMQTTFYAFSNAYHNRISAETISVVRNTLEHNWDGIGPWRA